MKRTVTFFQLIIMGLLLVGVSQVGAQIPTTALELWLDAATPFETNLGGVEFWPDISGNSNHAVKHINSPAFQANAGVPQIPTMSQTTATFGNGTHDVVRFVKDGFFELTDSAPFRSNRVGVYAVLQFAEIPGFDDRAEYFSTYSNATQWGYGYSLNFHTSGTPQFRYFTGFGPETIGENYISRDTSFQFTRGYDYYVVSVQIDTPMLGDLGAETGSKFVFINDDEFPIHSQSIRGIDYFDGPTASVGGLGQIEIFDMLMQGDLAELIVYSDTDLAQRQTVQGYLYDKYFGIGVAGPACDFDDNMVCDIDDLDALVAEIVAGTNDPDFDLTGDGSVDINDITDANDGWLLQAGEENIGPGRPYLVGDANLDETVDGADFLAWNTNKFMPVAAWSAGDFNADGTVDGGDFLLWNNNKFMSADGGSAVPEPAGVALALLALGLLSVRRRGSP